MRRFLIGSLMVGAVTVSAPALADPLAPGASGVAFSTFNPATRGTALGTLSYLNQSAPGDLATYIADLRTAVYRNTSGTLDFWYQVRVNSIEDGDVVARLTASNFRGYQVNAFVSGAALGDPDGAGIFTAPFNPGGFTSTAARNGSGFTIGANFGANGLIAGETSATYIFRTNATNFARNGTFATIDGSTVTVSGFRPIGPAVPEPATWGMMILGFGVAGAAMRRRVRSTAVSFA